MNPFLLILALTPGIVKGIQTVVGDKAAGATKQQMAKDALAAALEATGSVLGGNNAVFAQVAGAIAGLAIDQTVAIAKSTGEFGKWTSIATAAQQDLSVANGVIQLVQSFENPPVAGK